MAAVTIRTRALATVALLVWAGQVDAGRPLVTDDAYPVEQGRVEEDLILDAAIGRSFTARPQVEFFATVGLTWTFDAPWKRRNR